MKKGMLRKGLVLTIIVMFFGTSVVPSTEMIGKSSKQIMNRGILYVGGSGEGNYTEIQDAIDNASNGDTVFVFNGTYYGHILINKSINLFGEDKNTTFIIGYVAYTISIISDWVNISGFTIQNYERLGEGVRIYSCYNHVFNNIIDIPNDNIRISAEYNTISGNTITGDSLILSGDRNTISDNTITNDNYGIYLSNSYDNIISNNSFFNSGLFLSEDTNWNNIVTNNMVNGKPLVYLYDVSDLVLDFDAGQIILVNCTNITVQNQEIFNTTVGIQILGSNTSAILSNTIEGNLFGMYMYGWNNTISDNTISNNKDGLFLSGFNNIIYHNNFIDNVVNANDEGNNIWDDGSSSGGNFWDDYNGKDNNGDGIGDTPYFIPGGENQDNYPLMYPFGPPYANFTYDFLTSVFNASKSGDYNGEIVSYDWDFGDGTTGEGEIVYHKFCEAETFYVTLTVTDDDSLKNNFTECVDVLVPNIPPLTPEIYGPNHGKSEEELEYVFIANDPDDDNFYLRVDWGDEDSTGWIELLDSGDPVKLSHAWNKSGTYTVMAKVKDECVESEWVILEVTIPRKRAVISSWFIWVFERFPLLERLLSLIKSG